MSRTSTLILPVLILAATGYAQAQDNAGHDHSHDHGSMNMAAAPADAMTPGEVRKVDKSAGKVTITHGEIKNLDMGAMTMVFQVKDPAMLDKLKAGDHIRFTAESKGGALTLTRIEPAQ